jgi:hypothetical protein
MVQGAFLIEEHHHGKKEGQFDTVRNPEVGLGLLPVTISAGP